MHYSVGLAFVEALLLAWDSVSIILVQSVPVSLTIQQPLRVFLECQTLISKGGNNSSLRPAPFRGKFARKFSELKNMDLLQIPVVPIPRRASQVEITPEELEEIQNVKTKIYQKETKTTWTIPNVRDNWIIYFSSSSGKDRASSSLYVDVVEGDRPVKFTFNLFYLEQDEDDEGEFYFHFKPTDIPGSVKSLEGNYILEILDKNGEVWKTYDGPLVDWITHNPATHSHHHNEFDVQNHELDLSVSALLRDDVLGDEDKLTCRVTFCRMVSKCPHNVDLLQEQVAKSVDKVLWDDMEALLQDPKYADVQIRTKDGASIPAHRLILSARVPMFRAMFETDMLEKSSGVVETPEIGSKAMGIILHYIYTGKLHPDWKDAEMRELLNGADQYGLDGLIQYCNHLLITLCNDQNAKHLLEVAKLHQLNHAEEDISKYIKGILLE